jgi:LmbE family N-acetylglucosaminyl deacetylase
MALDASNFHVLAIHAHPDDIEIQCAGTLRRLRKLGCRISVATMTPGDGGSAEHTAEEISAIRREEARRAAVIMDAEYTCLEFRDLSIVFDNDSRRRVTEFVRRTAPAIILTAPPIDYMHDHEITSALVRDACFNASVPNYRTGQWDPAPPTLKIPWLYYVDPVEGTDHFGNRIPPEFCSRHFCRNADQAGGSGLPCQSAKLAPSSAWNGRVHGCLRTLESSARPGYRDAVWRRFSTV